MEFTYSYSDGTKNLESWFSGKASNPDEIKQLLDKSLKPKSGVLISLPESNEFGSGSIDFWRLEDGQIEMEILQGWHDDFAILDIPTAKQVVDMLFKSSVEKLVRDMLQELPIKWI
jgi:hypothetical protein